MSGESGAPTRPHDLPAVHEAYADAQRRTEELAKALESTQTYYQNRERQLNDALANANHVLAHAHASARQREEQLTRAYQEMESRLTVATHDLANLRTFSADDSADGQCT